MEGAGSTLESAFARLRAFADDGVRMARNAIRVCFTFTLLERRSLDIDSLPELSGERAALS
ncbi:MAG: hypothetical protein JSR83_24675 [Proteobacteria bacterium]|nr:hypothetical protein [Pseudomonadota bacterium]